MTYEPDQVEIVRQLVSDCGGPTAFAVILNRRSLRHIALTPWTVNMWMQRGKIPEKYIPLIRRVLDEKSIQPERYGDMLITY